MKNKSYLNDPLIQELIHTVKVYKTQSTLWKTRYQKEKELNSILSDECDRLERECHRIARYIGWLGKLAYMWRYTSKNQKMDIELEKKS